MSSTAIAYNGQLMARKLMTGDEVWKRKYSGYRDMAVTGNAIVLTDKPQPSVCGRSSQWTRAVVQLPSWKTAP